MKKALTATKNFLRDNWHMLVTIPSTFISVVLLTNIVIMTRPDLIEIIHTYVYFFYLGFVPVVINFRGLMSCRLGRAASILHLVVSHKISIMMAVILAQTAQDFAGSIESTEMHLAVLVTFHTATASVCVSAIYKVIFKEDELSIKQVNTSLVHGYRAMKEIMGVKAK